MDQSSTQELLSLVAWITPLPEQFATVRSAIEAMVPLTLAEAGCFVFRLHEVDGDPKRLCLYEVFENEAALKEHLQKDFAREVFELYKSALAAPLSVTRMRPLARQADWVRP